MCGASQEQRNGRFRRLDEVMRARRPRQDLRELRPVVPDACSQKVRDRIAAQVAKLKPDVERDALLWVEAISEFDHDRRERREVSTC
jgi:hypothetical protein